VAVCSNTQAYERLSAEDNLEFYGRVAGLPISDRREWIKQVLQSLGLWDRRTDAAGTWSQCPKTRFTSL
jgi:ABC-2 type transport system ATP-binding protein